ncbi:hypothetical protein Ac2012v2_008159 [Leucoagaricus gongylophorus]
MTAPTVRVSVPAPIYTRDPFGSRFSRCSISSCEYPDTPRTLTFDESGYTVLYTLPGDSHDCSIPHLDSTPSLFQPGHILPAESDCAVKSDCSATLLKPTILSLHLFRFGFLFPPLWLVGSLILLYPLHNPFCTGTPDSGSWIHAKKQPLPVHTRKVELKYAKWCFLALVVFVCIVGIVIGLALWSIRR